MGISAQTIKAGVVSAGGAIVLAFSPDAFPQFAKIATVVGALMLAGGLLSFLPIFGRKEGSLMDEKKKSHTVGLHVRNAGGGTGMEINTNPASLDPAATVNVTAMPGQSFAGVQIDQFGAGTGMVINHMGGQGRGLEINVFPPPKDAEEKP